MITGSAAGGLSGLTFVVIALAGEGRRVDAVGLQTFISPTMVHFAAVLGLSAFLCVPRQTLLSVGVGLGTVGAAGLLYAAVIGANMHHNLQDYVAVIEDWAWHVILPGSAYAGLAAMAVLMQQRPEAAEYGIAAASLVLLLTGIHNAWDIAVWTTTRRRDPGQTTKPGGQAG